MSNIETDSAGDWLSTQFEYEYCAECGGDSEHHRAIPFLGNWFAHCLYPPSAATNWEYHPVIQAFRARKQNESKN